MDFETAAPKETGEEVPDKSEDALPALKERDLTVLHCYKGHTPKHMAEITGMSYINA